MIQKNKDDGGREIVFKSFIGGIENGMEGYGKNRIQKDMSGDNLFGR